MKVNVNQDSNVAIKAYEAHVFAELTQEQKALFILQHPSLMILLIQENSLTEDDKQAIFFPIKDVPREQLAYYSAAYLSASKNEAVAFSLYSNPALFNLMSDNEKVGVALNHPLLAKKMFLENFLEKLNKDAFSFFITCYVVNNDMPLRYGPITSEQRDLMALAIAKQPHLIANLYPAARILLFSRVQQMQCFQAEPELLCIPEEIFSQIKQSYTLPIDLDKLLFWLPCIVGMGDSDYWGRFNAVFDTALGRYDLNQQLVSGTQSPENKMQAEALAMSLIQDERFVIGYQSHYYPNIYFGRLTNEHRIKLGSKYLKVALELFNQKENFSTFSLEEKARLALSHPGMMMVMIASPSAEDQKAIFSIIPDAKIETEFKYFPAVYLSAHSNGEVAFKLYNSSLFKRLSDLLKVKIILQHPLLIQKVLSDKFLEKLDKDALSFFTACCVMNNDCSLHYGSFSNEDREQIAISIVCQSKLVHNLHPAARLLLFSRVQRMEIFKMSFQENFPLNPLDLEDFYIATCKINNLNIPEEILQIIVHTYPLPAKQNKLMFWLYSILNIGMADYWGRFNDLYQTAVGYYGFDQQIMKGEQSPEHALQAETLAMSLVQDERFIHGLESQYNPGRKFCVLTAEQRVKLGIKYPRVAFELLTNKNSQGAIPFTLVQLLEIANAHSKDARLIPYLRHFTRMKVEYDKVNKDKREICGLYDESRFVEEMANTNSNSDSNANSNNIPKKIPRLSTLIAASFWENPKIPLDKWPPSEISEEVNRQLVDMRDHLQLFKAPEL